MLHFVWREDQSTSSDVFEDPRLTEPNEGGTEVIERPRRYNNR